MKKVACRIVGNDVIITSSNIAQSFDVSVFEEFFSILQSFVISLIQIKIMWLQRKAISHLASYYSSCYNGCNLLFYIR